MKRLLCPFLLIMSYAISMSAATANKDSLIHLAQATTNLNIKTSAYRNLADIFLKHPEEKHYLSLTYQTALKVGNKDIALEALCDLASTQIINQNSDSIYYYMDLIRQQVPPNEVESYLGQIRMKFLDSQSKHGKQEGEEAFEYESAYLKKADKNNIYIQIEQSYIIGTSLYTDRKFKEAAPHLENAYKLANTLSGKNASKYQLITIWMYANNLSNVGSKEKCIELLETTIDLYKSSYEKEYAKQRPYYPINTMYLKCYVALLMRTNVLPQEKAKYFLEKMKGITQLVDNPADKYNGLLGMSYYYFHTNDYSNAIKANDSLIKIAENIAPTVVSKLYDNRASIYENMGNYRDALQSHRTYVRLKDSLASQETKEQINTLQVEYQVDKLKLEKTKLENKNRRVQLITLSIILLITIIVCVYLAYHWKKEKEVKLKLSKLNQKAEESEKLKTEFINSMCHEIRTPLNAIVGFSGIIVDESFDNDTKKEFYDLVGSNTILLTSLIDDLLVVANLDSSDETLSCQMTNINDLCREEFRKASDRNKKGLEYLLDLPEEDITLPTHNKYLALVIENILSNAYKFTQQGRITMTLQKNEAEQRLLISITDTGCGIPLDKQEVIFERFTKLDSFTQGNGLGLFLSKLIINRLSGNIYVDPSYTDGACIIISLPCKY